jgi:hypothetical protein
VPRPRAALEAAPEAGAPAPGPAEPDAPSAEAQELERLLFVGGEVARWATFGLGRRCSPSAPELERALLVHAAHAVAAAEMPSDADLELLGWALGQCATPDTEAALRGWLEPPPQLELEGLVGAAGVGLAAQADRAGALSERTQAALLDAAASRRAPQLLAALARLRHLHDAVAARLLEVAGDLLVDTRLGDRRAVVLALGSAGPTAADALGQVLLSDAYSVTERGAAAQALARLESEGQRALDASVAELLARGLPLEATSERWPTVYAALLGLDAPRTSVRALRELSALVLPDATTGALGAQRRRLIWLRCRAADLLARDATLSAPLLACDPERGSTFALAQLRVLERSRIEGPRLRVLEAHLASADPRVAQAALRLLAGHGEVEGSADYLLAALRAPLPGTQATACQVLSAYPSRGHPRGKSEAPDPRIIEALAVLLAPGERPPETVAAALRAAGALGSLRLKPAVEAYCRGPRASLRAAAESALGLLGSPEARCDDPVAGAATAASTTTEPPLAEPFRVRFSSDVGELTLRFEQPDTEQARAALRALLSQAGEPWVHGVSPGQALQLGDPDGDGFDAEPYAEAPSELVPAPFVRGAVAMSAFFPGEQHRQLFVSLSGAPELFGRRLLVGQAEGPWQLLLPGDRLGSPRVEPLAQPSAPAGPAPH